MSVYWGEPPLVAVLAPREPEVRWARRAIVRSLSDTRKRTSITTTAWWMSFDTLTMSASIRGPATGAMMGDEDHWVTMYPGDSVPWHLANIIELRDGKWSRRRRSSALRLTLRSGARNGRYL